MIFVMLIIYWRVTQFLLNYTFIFSIVTYDETISNELEEEEAILRKWHDIRFWYNYEHENDSICTNIIIINMIIIHIINEWQNKQHNKSYNLI